MSQAPAIAVLCGSTKFKGQFEEQNMLLTLDGYIVLSVGMFAHADGVELDADTKVRLDELHKRKIDLADLVVVINVDGYIGESTRSEIAYAERLGKSINYLVRNRLDVDHG